MVEAPGDRADWRSAAKLRTWRRAICATRFCGSRVLWLQANPATLDLRDATVVDSDGGAQRMSLAELCESRSIPAPRLAS